MPQDPAKYDRIYLKRFLANVGDVTDVDLGAVVSHHKNTITLSWPHLGIYDFMPTMTGTRKQLLRELASVFKNISAYHADVLIGQSPALALFWAKHVLGLEQTLRKVNACRCEGVIDLAYFRGENPEIIKLLEQYDDKVVLTLQALSEA